MMEKSNQIVLVTGANGNLGRAVIEKLLAKKGNDKIILGSRQPDTLKTFIEKGFEIRKVDFEDTSSLTEAFAGVDRILLISTKSIGTQRQQQHKNAIDIAVKSGIKHMVYTSMLGPEKSLVTFAPDHDFTEKALKSSGLEWTILRNSWYMENLLTSLPQILASAKWFTAAGNGKVAYVSREDCAEAAVMALLSSSTINKQIDITGPRALSVDDIAKIVSDVFGKTIKVQHLSDIELREKLISTGMPAPLVPLVVSSDANTRAGNMNLISNGVRDLAGHEPQSLSDFLAHHNGTTI